MAIVWGMRHFITVVTMFLIHVHSVFNVAEAKQDDDSVQDEGEKKKKKRKKKKGKDEDEEDQEESKVSLEVTAAAEGLH